MNVIAEVNIAADECSSEINEYFLSTVNKPPSDVMSNITWVEDSLEMGRRLFGKVWETCYRERATIRLGNSICGFPSKQTESQLFQRREIKKSK